MTIEPFSSLSKMPNSVRVQRTEVRCQMSENREPESVGNEPQNIEYRMLNIKGKENFAISASGGFDIQKRGN
jgi:hypothetical protein